MDKVNVEYVSRFKTIWDYVPPDFSKKKVLSRKFIDYRVLNVEKIN